MQQQPDLLLKSAIQFAEEERLLLKATCKLANTTIKAKIRFFLCHNVDSVNWGGSAKIIIELAFDNI